MTTLSKNIECISNIYKHICTHISIYPSEQGGGHRRKSNKPQRIQAQAQKDTICNSQFYSALIFLPVDEAQLLINKM